jgi:hypothetical protein
VQVGGGGSQKRKQKRRVSANWGMGGESSSSSVESGGEGGGGGRMGIQTEMIRIPGAQLCLIDGEESVHMQSGDFALSLLKQTHSPLAVVVANVGEVQWPVGKDAPVLKVWTRRYTFALPGLVYGLILPDTTSNIVLQQLENILARYCAFQIHHEIANSGMVIKLHPSCSPDLNPSPYSSNDEFWR